MAPSIQKRHCSKQDWHSDDFGLRSPVSQIFFSPRGKIATSIVERVSRSFHARFGLPRPERYR